LQTAGLGQAGTEVSSQHEELIINKLILFIYLVECGYFAMVRDKLKSKPRAQSHLPLTVCLLFGIMIRVASASALDLFVSSTRTAYLED
jgi:hypothetical protein